MWVVALLSPKHIRYGAMSSHCSSPHYFELKSNQIHAAELRMTPKRDVLAAYGNPPLCCPLHIKNVAVVSSSRLEIVGYAYRSLPSCVLLRFLHHYTSSIFLKTTVKGVMTCGVPAFVLHQISYGNRKCAVLRPAFFFASTTRVGIIQVDDWYQLPPSTQKQAGEHSVCGRAAFFHVSLFFNQTSTRDKPC